MHQAIHSHSTDDSRPALPLDTILHGDCETMLASFPDASIDLIVTSPPYADSRKNTYGGIHPDAYLDPFVGSGTTAAVAQSLGRRFIGIELNESYYQLALESVGQGQPI